MRFLLGLLIGGGIGYVLGTRDGRERFDEIIAGVSELIGEEMTAQLTEFLDQGGTELRKAATKSGDAAGEALDGD